MLINAVGYQNKTDTRALLNYITPTFRSVAGEQLTVQAIQLDASVGDSTAFLQRLDDGAAMLKMYYWYTVATAKTIGAIEAGDTSYDKLNGVWLEQYTYEDRGRTKTGYRLPSDELGNVATGDGFQIQLPSGENFFQFNGEVGEDDMLQKSRNALNFIGNPYPANCPIQNVQLDNSVGDSTAFLQYLDDGCAMLKMYYWYTVATAKTIGAIAAGDTTYDDLNGVWLEQYTYEDRGRTKTGYRLPTDEFATLTGGSAVQIQMPADDLDMFVLAPYDL